MQECPNNPNNSDIVYFIYLTINKVNGKMYIGQHHCKREEQFTDGYLGSGSALQQAIKKYGVDNFERIILEYANSPEELNALEERYVDVTIVENDLYYNLKTGGMQHIIFSEETRKKISEACRNISEETRQRMSESHLGQIPWCLGKHHSEETKQKLRAINSGKTVSQETRCKISIATRGEKNPFYGKHHTDAARQRLREVNLGKHHNEETKQKCRAVMIGRKNALGYHPTEETLQKMREASLGSKNPFFGKRHSEEQKAKWSAARSGANNPNFGKHFSEEHKQKIREANQGKHWWTNGIRQCYCRDCPGEDFKLGMLPRENHHNDK